MPAAALQLRQGFGRLVRSRADRGLVAVLDPRTGEPFGSVEDVLQTLIQYNLARPNEKFLGYVDGAYRFQSRIEAPVLLSERCGVMIACPCSCRRRRSGVRSWRSSTKRTSCRSPPGCFSSPP